MTNSDRDGHITLEVLPLESDRWSNLEPMDIEWLRSSISTDEEKLRERMDAIQKEAYACYPYPCIRTYGFARLDAPRHALYSQIIEAGKTGDTVYLDFACCMGTDARKVVADGYPAQNVFACDLRQEFLDYGHRLYDDASTCGIHFLTANAFNIPYPPKGPIVTDLANVKEVDQLRGRVTHLYAGLFFHLFDEAAQYDLALRLGTLVKHESGTVLYGRQMGITEPQDLEDTGMFLHSPESWTQMWKKAFAELENADFAENRVVVKAELVQLAEKNIVKLKTKSELPVLYWSVQIV